MFIFEEIIVKLRYNAGRISFCLDKILGHLSHVGAFNKIEEK